MKKISVLLLGLVWANLSYAQLGKDKTALRTALGEESILKESAGKPGYSSLLFKLDSTQFVQATFKEQQAVMLSYFSADSALSEPKYKQFLQESLPNFVPKKTCRLGNKTYLFNAQENQLVVQTHTYEEETFPLMGLILVNDPAIIAALSDKIRQVCR